MNDKEIIELITLYVNTLVLKENLEKELERILKRKISTSNDVVKNES